MRRKDRTIQSLHAELEQALLMYRTVDTRFQRFLQRPQYQSGFHDGVTVSIGQLKKWLEDSRAAAEKKLAHMLANCELSEHYWRGHETASEWINEAIAKLGEELEGRAHAVATGHQEDAG